MNSVKSFHANGNGRHNHSHNLPIVNVETLNVVAKDALLRTDNLITRQSFQSRFVKTSRGDRKCRPGRSFEHTEALLDNQIIDEAKLAMVEAGVEADVIVETEPKQADILVDDSLNG